MKHLKHSLNLFTLIGLLTLYQSLQTGFTFLRAIIIILSVAITLMDLFLVKSEKGKPKKNSKK